MDKGNIKLSLVSFIFAAAALGSGMQVGASGYDSHACANFNKS